MSKIWKVIKIILIQIGHFLLLNLPKIIKEITEEFKGE